MDGRSEAQDLAAVNRDREMMTIVGKECRGRRAIERIVKRLRRVVRETVGVIRTEDFI